MQMTYKVTVNSFYHFVLDFNLTFFQKQLNFVIQYIYSYVSGYVNFAYQN